MNIGPYQLNNPVILAPMAGITDRPFRQLCREFGAGLAFSEMVSANPQLRKTRKSQFRTDYSGESGIRAVQIVGTEPQQLADAAQYNTDMGAQIIDINMGCPAKKVCNKAAGSALLKDERLVADILSKVVSSVSVPVTLKIRTGWDQEHRNAPTIAKIAEDNGIQALTIHGRTRRCAFSGEAEYETIQQVKQQVAIPIVANGDINSPEKAKSVLQKTGADAIMVGRSACGRPWIFEHIIHYLNNQQMLDQPTRKRVWEIMLQHIAALHQFYGEPLGVRIARKHIRWYFETLTNIPVALCQELMRIDQPEQQLLQLQTLSQHHSHC